MWPVDGRRAVVRSLTARRHFELIGAQALLLVQPHDAEKKKTPSSIHGSLYFDLEGVAWDCYAMGVYQFRHPNKMAHMIATRLEA